MKRTKTLFSLGLAGALAGGGASLLALSCADYLTGQKEEPSGPLQITKLTLFENTSRDVAVFTDTSLPDCSTVNLQECASPDKRETTDCRVCYNDTFKDRYGVKKSPPNPDSGRDIRVVTNKVPLVLDGKDLGDTNPATGKPVVDEAVSLKCDGCSGIPTLRRTLIVSGSGISFDPVEVPYGPSLQLKVVPSAELPLAALEPDTSYEVTVAPGLAGRDGQKVDLAPAAALLRFKTEPLRVLSVGVGLNYQGGKLVGESSPWIYKAMPSDPKDLQDGTTAHPYKLARLPKDAAVAVRWNAPMHIESIKKVPLTFGYTENGMLKTLKVSMGGSVFKARKMDGTCDADSQRVLYLYPTDEPVWPVAASKITLLIPAGTLRDVAQTAGHPAGKHVIDHDFAIDIEIDNTTVAKGYSGTTIEQAKSATSCPALVPMDMTAAPDLSGGDMARRDM